MERTKAQALPLHSGMLLGFCALGVLLFSGAGIYPAHRKQIALEAEAARLHSEIEEQRILHELVASLDQQKKAAADLPAGFVLRQPLGQDQLDRIEPIFDEIASKNGMAAVAFQPNADSLSKHSNFLLVNGVLRGPFARLQAFLADVAALPFLKHVEEVQVREVDGKTEYRLKLWLELT